MPNPGSPEAMAQGCLCPVKDNNGGRVKPPAGDTQGDPNAIDGWWVTEGCPLHRPEVP